MLNIHQVSTSGVNEVTNGDFAEVLPLGELSLGAADGLGLFCADGGFSSTEELSTGRLAGTIFQQQVQDQWRLSVCATASDRVRATLLQALSRTNRMLFQEGLDRKPVCELSVSMVAGIVHRGVLIYSNLGNVRLFLLREGVFHRLTEDHTYSHSLASRGLIRRRTELVHPYSNLVSRRLGMGYEVDLQLRSMVLKPNDILMMMTDGMGSLRSSQQLNQRIGKLVCEWLAQEIEPADIPVLLKSQLSYYLPDMLRETRDVATFSIVGFGEEDLMRLHVQPMEQDDAAPIRRRTPTMSGT